MIFLPYAIPAVIGALMWGFLYSPSFGPMEQIAGLFDVERRSCSARTTSSTAC